MAWWSKVKEVQRLGSHRSMQVPYLPFYATVQRLLRCRQKRRQRLAGEVGMKGAMEIIEDRSAPLATRGRGHLRGAWIRSLNDEIPRSSRIRRTAVPI